MPSLKVKASLFYENMIKFMKMKLQLCIILVIICLFTSKVIACDCPPIERDTLVSQGLKNYDIVFLGEVISSKNDSYSLRVLEIFKGDYSEKVINGKVFNNCSVKPNTGFWIVYANIRENLLIDISLCSSSFSLNETLSVPELIDNHADLDRRDINKLNERLDKLEDWNYSLIKLRALKSVETNDFVLLKYSLIFLSVLVMGLIFVMIKKS